MNDIISKFCPMTIMLNVGAIGVSLTDLEIQIKLISYTVAILYTIIKITKEIKDWKKK